MCFYNGIEVTRAEHIRLKRVEKEVGAVAEALHRPLQSGFAYGEWPVLKPLSGGADFELALMHGSWCHSMSTPVRSWSISGMAA